MNNKEHTQKQKCERKHQGHSRKDEDQGHPHHPPKGQTHDHQTTPEGSHHHQTETAKCHKAEDEVTHATHDINPGQRQPQVNPPKQIRNDKEAEAETHPYHERHHPGTKEKQHHGP
jgi:hypothetical protein